MAEIAAFIRSLPLPFIALTLFGIYALITTIFIIMENRSPQSTLAWMLVLLGLPALGIVIYLFFGRGYKAFSQQRKLVHQELGGPLTGVLTTLAQAEAGVIARLQADQRVRYRHKLLQLVRQNPNSMLTAWNRLEILQNADQKYPRLLADIEAARQFIHMEYFSWSEDRFTEQVRELLIRKAREGVEVRILVDALSFNRLSRRYVQGLRDAGVEIYGYLNFLSLFKIHNISYRNHRKIAIIDGRIGYLGGMNMGQEHLDGGPHFPGWRDTHLRLVGEAALVLQAIFVTSWFNTKPEALSDAKYFPPVDRGSLDYLPVHITTAGPDSQWAAIKQLYFAMISAAEKRIVIQSPFFIPDDSIREALLAAAFSGVEIKIMCTPRGTTYSIPYWAANTYFKEMAEAGIRIFLYREKYFHPKTISIDSEICCVGTANMDVRSFTIDYEANAVVYDRDITEQLEADFEADLACCDEFTLEGYKKRAWPVHLRDSLARLASPVL